MADSYVLESMLIGRNYFKLKFRETLQVASISADKFKVLVREDAATPQEPNWNDESVISFHDIIIRDHFNSIRRELTLYFDGENLPTGTYWFGTKGLRKATGALIYGGEADFVPFSYNYDNAPIDDATEDQPVVIEDFSIKQVTDLNTSESPATGGFAISETLPSHGDVFIEADYNDGTISAHFTKRPNLVSLTGNHIKLQRKKIGGTSFRWETLDSRIALDADNPIVYVYTPSLDATPVYYTSGHEYFEAGYKYRVIFSKAIHD